MAKENGMGNKCYNAKIRFYILLLIEIALWFSSIAWVRRLGMKHVTEYGIINIVFDWAGMFILIIVLYSCIQGRKAASSNAFMYLTFAIHLCLFFEVGMWLVDKVETLRPWNYICNIGGNSMMLIGTFLFLEFICKSLDIKKKTIAFLFWSCLAMTICEIVAEIINIWLSFMYYIDASGTYVRMTYGSLLGYIPYVYIILVCAYLVLKQPILLSKKINYLSYVIFPLCISIWYTFTGCPPSLYIASFIAVFYLYANIYIRQGREMEAVALESVRKDVELAWQRNQLMLSQIKPHFIFNCLGSIEELCRLDPEEARNAVHRFSKYLRANMDSISDKYLIPFSNELEHIRNYVWLEQMRFEDDLEYQEKIEVTEFSLPPLTIQPLVENAIKHGMMGMEDGVLKVVLSVKETEDCYQIEITDNGAGFDPDTEPNDGRSHIGVKNVKESLHSKVNGTLIIESEIGTGTRVQVCIPKEMTENENISSGR